MITRCGENRRRHVAEAAGRRHHHVLGDLEIVVERALQEAADLVEQIRVASLGENFLFARAARRHPVVPHDSLVGSEERNVGRDELLDARGPVLGRLVVYVHSHPPLTALRSCG